MRTSAIWVRAVKGNKDDVKDSRYRSKLVSCKSSEKNHFQNAFTVCNVALDAVVSDMFGKSATSITDYLITSDEFDSETCVSFLQRSLKSKTDSVIESIERYHMTKEQKSRMVMIRSHLQFVDGAIAKIDSKLDGMVAPYENVISLLAPFPELRGILPSPLSPRLVHICLNLPLQSSFFM